MNDESRRDQNAVPGAESTNDNLAEGSIQDQILAQIVDALRGTTGHDFGGYRQNTFRRRVERRMMAVQAKSIEDYADLLQTSPEEVAALLDDLLIGVTAFFRDRDEFAALEREVIPKLFEGKTSGDDVRAWVLGCATGEEAYSIAILFSEHMATMPSPPRVQIFATDIDARALTVARRGRFSDSIVADVSPERLERWFVRNGTDYVAISELREMCIFSQHSLLSDPPFSHLDLLSCRNLLIYLKTELQSRVIPLLHYALRSGGYLFLGTAETATRRPQLFEPIDSRSRIYRRIDTVPARLPQFPLGTTRKALPTGPVDLALENFGQSGLWRRAERLAEKYAPAYVIVDARQTVQHFHGRIGRFIGPVSGAASLDVLSLIHRDLRADLRALLHRSRMDGRTVWADKVHLTVDEGIALIRITIEPIPAEAGADQNHLIVFEESDLLPFGAEGLPERAAAHHEHQIESLEDELRLSSRQHQLILEALESANEELESSNHQYQSINEEIQSANEELETSKEELQAVNEEMHSVNTELQSRILEVDEVNSDIRNLLDSTRIATVFLDMNLKVRSFTPALAEMFRLTAKDVGQGIVDLAARVQYRELSDDAKRVLRTLHPIEREVEVGEDDARYLVRILPYRSVDDVIGGVVVTFLDTSAIARAELALYEADERFRNIAKSAPLFLFIASGPLDWSYINPPFFAYSGLTEPQSLGKGWLKAVHPDDRPLLDAAWQQSAETGEIFVVEYRLRAANDEYHWFLSRGEPQLDDTGKAIRWYGSCTDVNDRRIAEDHLRMLLAELQHRVKNILAVVRSIFSRTVETSETLEDASAHFQGRLDALARTQSVLVRTNGGGVDLEEMIQEELAGFSGESGRIAIAGPRLGLKAAGAETMGLLVHELATNSAKYGALSQPKGHIAVSWRLSETAAGVRMTWEWRESGVAAINAAPTRRGFGRDLIETGAPYQLGAVTRLEFNPGGVFCSVELLLNERVAVIGKNSRKAAVTT